MKIRVGINGIGRIGKLVFRLLSESNEFELVAVNDPMPAEILKNLLRYDSIHGQFPQFGGFENGNLLVNNKQIHLTHYFDPLHIPWGEYGVDCVIEASGIFKNRQSLEQHLASGAQKVLLTQPSIDELDKTIVIGINEHVLRSSDSIISNASCTTNCLAPILKVLDDNWGIDNAFFNTVHPFTNNQSLMDGPHADPRRSRSAFCNIIPTTSTAVAAVKTVMPQFENKIDGFATRVPVSLGSYIEITAQLQKDTQVDQLNEAFKHASQTYPSKILEYCADPIVSSDIIGNAHSAVFDSLCSKVLGKRFVQVLAWYDNETAYSNRLLDVLKLWYKK